jgi:hypothetical protein
MSDNPFKIISPTDEVPEGLRGEVMGCVKLLMLLMRFVQLFVGDYTNAIFDNIRIVSGDRDQSGVSEPSTKDSK